MYFVSLVVFFKSSIHVTRDDGVLHLADRLGDLDLTRAALGAVKDGMASINSELVVQDPQALSSSPIPAVKYKAVCRNDRLWSNILVACPINWAGGSAAGAQDALGGVVKPLALFNAL